MFFGFSDHIWPAPLLAHTTFETVFCPNLCVENLGQWGCSSGQFVSHVLFFGPWTTLRWTPLTQDLCGIPRCGVGVSLLCRVVVCVHPTPLRWTPAPAPPRRTSLRRTAQNFAHFFPSPATIFVLSSLSWGSLRGISVVFLNFGV